MPKHTQYDNELAEFTDQLLAGKEPDMSTEETELADVVRQLQRTISGDAAPAPFKTQLTQRLGMEWDLHHKRQVRWWATPQVRRVTTLLAASVVLVIAAVLVLSTVDSDGGTGLEGSASGSATSIAIIALFVVGVLGLIVFFRRDGK